MNSLVNCQDQGAVKTLYEANQRIADARRDTPTAQRDLFRSYIKFVTGLYEWGWILK